MTKNSNKWALTSLSVCTASASFVVGGPHGTVQAEEPAVKPRSPDWQKERVAQQVVYQYLNPISAVTEGNLAVEKEEKPLMVEVEPGDTLYAIGQQYGVSAETLTTYNSVADPHTLQVGQKVKVPVVMERIRVKEEDTLTSIAEKYDVEKNVLIEANPDLKLTEDLYIGQVLVVPQAFEPKQPKPVQAATAPKKGQTTLSSASVSVDNQQSSGFQWPARGQITSGYGWRNGSMHTGIDIANPQGENNLIKSSKGGTVIQSGYSGGYGNLVVVDHGDGWTTYYAHLSRIIVGKGQKVGQGGGLGYMGTTGNSTGVHLHFEVRKNDQPINPLNVLP
ncbi:M23 family metallopeptidase [Desmospora activa]|uniref:Murein DD-endopeptidase MepM/ murein hydrolase activator NlpD n=1 Tax=Desmospora activa DSM 45169 TaxID=1121389 RepID=A0A2T4Z4F8_9BACL|nr:M23 family metallopeptidase [Desmospora activa]PTM56778.1 murein DD-endopeptidase MepM/ murein hydrolase activator NlpD [Desmospora activa DSM 45169]